MANQEDEASAQQALKYITAAVAEAEEAAAAAQKRVDLLRLAAQTISDAVGVGSVGSNHVDLARDKAAAAAAIAARSWTDRVQRFQEGQQPPLSTVEAVRTVLRTKPGKFFTVNEIVSQMQAQGLLRPDLKEPRNTVLEAAKRLERRSSYAEREDRDGVAMFRIKPGDYNGYGQPTIEEATGEVAIQK